MRKFFPFLLMLLVFVFPFSVKAESPVEFDSLNVNIWPEYDTQTVLVIYKIALSQKVSLPVDITLKTPAGVEKIYTVAVGDSESAVSDSGVDYTFTPGKDSSSVKIKATGRFLQIEYYDSGLASNGNQRAYLFNWNGDYKVANFKLEFRQPLEASNLVVTPALTKTMVDQDGFEFSEFTKSAVAAGEKLTFDIKYQRQIIAPSTSGLKIEPSAPLDQNVVGQSTWTNYLPWILGGIGVALLLIAGWTYWTSSRGAAGELSRKRHQAKSAVSGEADGQVYCAQCGKRAQASDRFCRVCGARIRRTEE